MHLVEVLIALYADGNTYPSLIPVSSCFLFLGCIAKDSIRSRIRNLM